ncbi:MAG: sugar ABC transporter substrate-binding protein [Treponema sp.]|jgi:multiple sugar transport system substrate-binding protein|nr:sugar ABC transporter substrate-binding protein [Treponema sp.]
MKRKALALGIILLLVAAMVFAGGNRAQSGSETAKSVSGAFDWRRANGAEITVYMVQHPTQESIMAKLDEFTRLTGIRVRTQVTPEANYFDQVSNGLSSRTGTPDIFMSGAYMLWDYYSAGNVEPLDDYLNNPALTNRDYDVGDFVQSAFNALKWDGVPGNPVGRGAQLGIPVQTELYMLAYNQRAFTKAGITKPPETYEELLAACDKLQGWDGPGTYAVAVRGARDWGTIHPAYMSTFRNFGAKDYEMEGGRLVSRVNSPESVRMNEFFVDMIKRGGSPQWSSMYWYMCMTDFGAGKAAMLWDASNAAANCVFANMAEAANIKYAPMPVARAGDTRHSNFWTWSLAMNSSSKNKIAAWLFLQYFSTKEFLISASVDSDNMDPGRTSVYNNPGFQAKLARLPGWYDAWQKTVNTTTIQFTPHSAFFAATTEWAATLQDLVAGTRYPNVKAGLDALKITQDRMLRDLD